MQDDSGQPNINSWLEDELLHQYNNDRKAVDPSWAKMFDGSNGTTGGTGAPANGASYSLIYTNLSGITTPRTNWFTNGSPIIGAGGVTNFTDTTAGSDRIYSVTGH